jgi:endo-1,4-beta-xylanase
MTSKGLMSLTALFSFFLNITFGEQLTLKEAFNNDFLIGSAIDKRQFHEKDIETVDIVKTQFNSVTSENILKWESIHSSPNEYDFASSDQFVQFGQENKMFIIGHTLVWHQQTPAWVFEDEEKKPIDRHTLLERLRDHIYTVVGRYKGKIHGWDVINEALNDDGTLRLTPWLKILGENYIIQAFQFAHEADPEAELYYNDYGLESPLKRAGAIALIRKIQENGTPITAIGLQSHNTLDWPSTEQLEDTLVAFAKLGIKINITELDIDVLPSAWQYQGLHVSSEMHTSLDPYVLTLPSLIDQALTRRYAELFRIYLKYQEKINRVTFWGVTDRNSWLNDIPIKGRTNYPLLFDREGQPKPAFDAIISLKTGTF